MTELRYPNVFILAPPFLSHFGPLVSLGRSLSELGARVTVGCSPDFREDTLAQGLRFVEVRINRNANRGVALDTDQDVLERLRLTQFLDATRRGPIETLITQAEHRAADMLADPEELIHRIREIRSAERPSLWIVDQLSYGATLALYGMDEPFVTFCAPHPHTIPAAGEIYSVPPAWPSVFSPKAPELGRLRATARQVESRFTRRFNQLLHRHFGKEPVESAFGLVSSVAVIFNYPPFAKGPAQRDELIFAGHSYRHQDLPADWKDRVSRGEPRVLLALGTFLSSRADVMLRVIQCIKKVRPNASVFVGAGSSLETLASIQTDSINVERFIPQRALLQRVDLAIHHGGVSSFTETLYTQKPMIVMPFSSDQFSVAKDVEYHNLGAVLDPNGFTSEDLDRGLARLAHAEVGDAVARWSSVIRSRGPGYAARRIQGLEGSI